MTECTCPECIECCKHRPGWFKPGEAEKAAAYLGLSLPDFFKKYLVVDFWLRMEGDINLLIPKQVEQEGGRKLSYSDAFHLADCIFLSKDNRCTIHAVKPSECKMAMGCSDPKVDNWHEEVAMAWDKPKHQAQIKDLLSGERS